MADGLLRMAMRDESLMRRKGVVFLRVISRGFAVVPCRLLVMVRCGLVVLGSAESLAQEVPPSLAILGARRASELIGPRARSGRSLGQVRSADRVRSGQPSRMRGAECWTWGLTALFTTAILPRQHRMWLSDPL